MVLSAPWLQASQSSLGITYLSQNFAQIGNATLDLGAGIERLEAMADSFESSDIDRLRQFTAAPSEVSKIPQNQRPAIFLGAGELNTHLAVATILAGAASKVGVFFHELFIHMDTTTPEVARQFYIQLARATDMAALPRFAAEHGVRCFVGYVDLMLAQPDKGQERRFPDNLIEKIRSAGANPLVVNAVANLEQNDILLRETFRDAGLLGPESLWVFPFGADIHSSLSALGMRTLVEKKGLKPDNYLEILSPPKPPEDDRSWVKGEIFKYFSSLLEVFGEGVVRTEVPKKPKSKRMVPVYTASGQFSPERSEAIRRVIGEEELKEGPIPDGAPYTVSAKVTISKPSATQLILTLSSDPEGKEVIATGETLLFFDTGSSSGVAIKKEEPVEDLSTLGEEVGEEVLIDADLIRNYADASGDKNVIHIDPKVAKALGLQDTPFHGVGIDAFAHRFAPPSGEGAIYPTELFYEVIGPVFSAVREKLLAGNAPLHRTQVWTMNGQKIVTDFKTSVYPGDKIRFFRNGDVVTVVNQRSEIVLTRQYKQI